MLFRLLNSFLILWFPMMCLAQHNIIPTPVKYTATSDFFLLSKDIAIKNYTDKKEVDTYILHLHNYIDGLELHTSENTKASQAILISINQKMAQDIGNEGYTLAVTNNQIKINANHLAGIFYAFQTLKQLISTRSEAGEIAGCTIVDYPRFKWRGLMLDVSRHFFTVEEVKAYIDQMASYKFNVFHWHLTDDHGWRIEIKSLPKLTEIGAWRVERPGFFGVPDPRPGEPATYGGFYTQTQIKDIVQYAAHRNITIVPEIDMPGHSMAALAAYPEFSTKQEPKFVNPGTAFSQWFGDGTFKMLIENMLNPTDEKTYDFVDKIFTEVAQLFPGEYIHAGGDECYHGYWEEDVDVQAFMKNRGMNTSEELQNYFVGRVEKIIRSKGKKMIGWDEILTDDLSKEAAVMSWRGMKGGAKAASKKYQVVMSPTTFAYLDYIQGDASLENHVYASLSLEKTYQFNPAPDSIDNEYVMGGQGNLWTENVATLPFAFYMTYPRAFALSESLWSPTENKNWNNFIQRTEQHFQLFDDANKNICKAIYEPVVRVFKAGDSLMCALTCEVPNTEIYYTIDNTYPPKFGKKYIKPFLIPEGFLKLRTQTYRDNQSLGRAIVIDRKDLVKRIKR